MLRYLRRFSAWFFDYALSLGIFYFFLNLPLFSLYQSKLERTLSSDILASFSLGRPTEELIALIVSTYLFCSILRIYSTFFFGRTVGQVFAGIRFKDGFWWRRLGGSVRCLSSTFLGPILIDHLPNLLGRRSISEFLSLTTEKTLKLHKEKGAFLRSLTVLGISLLVFGYSQFSTILGPIHAYRYFDTKIYPPDLNKKTDFSNFKNYRSFVYQLDNVSDLESQDFVMFPGIDIRRVGRRVKRLPMVYFYDFKSQTLGSLKVETQVSLKNIFSPVFYANPTLENKLPTLSHFVKERKLSRKEADVEKEISYVLDEVFQISFENFIPKLLSIGPVLKGPMETRRKILDLINPSPSLQLQKVLIGEKLFFRLTQLKSNDREIEKIQEVYLPLFYIKGRALVFDWEGEKSIQQTREKLESSLISSSKWFPEDLNLENRKKEIEALDEWTVFDVVDGMSVKDLIGNEKVRSKLEAELISHFNSVLDAFKGRESDFKGIIADHYVQTIKRFKHVTKKSLLHFGSKDFQNSLFSIEQRILELKRVGLKNKVSNNE
ncbi:MAG: hypothetical protein ACPGJV_02370 [Bacteriovoracaceae bacterium]